MLSVILMGHGGFASGLEKAILQIIGEQVQFSAIDFPVESTTKQLDATLRKSLKEIESGEGTVIMTDLLGGTPFRVASLLSLEQENIEVITGTNLQMVAEMLLERDGLSANEFCKLALECGHRGITSLAKQQRDLCDKQDTVEDGI